ncbi:MAG: hypothetical protein WCG75_12795, partial [Armatimonadota bacterium]
VQAQLDEANALLAQRKYDDVSQLVQPLLIRDTGGQAQRLFGMSQLGLGKFQDAVHILMSAAQLMPDDPTVAFALGNAMNQNGQTEGARASFERALGLNPNHPGAKLGYLNCSKSLADEAEAKDPMKAIEWLYGPWQMDTTNMELGHRILDIYIKNGWNDSARQFVDLMPARIKNSDTVVAKLKALPFDAPPIDMSNIPGVTTTGGPAPIFEACMFCKQQIMSGLFQCPHCKMTLRAQRNMPGGNYKPEWQEVTLNITCWIGIALGAFIFLSVFMLHAQATTGGSFSLAIAGAIVIANILILNRNDTFMAVFKILYIISAMRSVTCGCLSFSSIGRTYGETHQALVIEFIILMIVGAYSGLMAYLLNYEGE